MARKRSPAPSVALDLKAFRASVSALTPAQTRVRELQGPLLDAVKEGVRMRASGETVCSLAEFHRFLSKVGVKVPGREAPLRLSLSYSALRNYVFDVLDYSWPRTTGATGIQVVPVTTKPRSK